MNPVLVVGGIVLLLVVTRVLDLSNFVWSLPGMILLAAPALLAFMILRANAGLVPAVAAAAIAPMTILIWSYRRPAEDWRKLWMLSRIDEFLKGLVWVCLVASVMILAEKNYAIGPWLTVGLPLAVGSVASWLLSKLSFELLNLSVRKDVEAYKRNMARLRASAER